MVAGRVQATAGPLAPLDQVTLSTANTGGAGTTPNSFAMYTRAADRVEVATAVAIGRTIDRLEKSAASIAQTVQVQSTTTNVMASNTREAASRTQEGLLSAKAARMSIGDVTKMTIELDSAAIQVEASAGMISDLVGQFLSSLRAA